MAQMYYWDKFKVTETHRYSVANVIDDAGFYTFPPGYQFSGENYKSVTLNTNTGVLTFNKPLTNVTVNATETTNQVFYEKYTEERYRKITVSYDAENNNYPTTIGGFVVTPNIDYSKGNFVETVQGSYDAYANNTRNKDGFWYLRGDLATNGAIYANVDGTIKKINNVFANVDGTIKRVYKIVQYRKTPFSIDNTVSIPFIFPQSSLTYQKYSEVLSRFPTANKEVFGRDASNTYDLVCVHIGTKGKPCIFINAGMHGTEWQASQYCVGFVLDLLNNTFPDVSLRDNLINNYHLVFIPCLNPYGMDKVGSSFTQTQARRNANYVDLNRDFSEGNQTQSETQAFVKLFRKYNPFACLDCHMFGPGYESAGGKYIIVGNGHAEQNDVKDTIINTVYNTIGGEVQNWDPMNSSTNNLLRAFAARQTNQFNIKTLSYITEIERPIYPLYSTDGSSKYTNPEIYQIGYLLNYLFLKTSIMYLEHYKSAKKIEIYF